MNALAEYVYLLCVWARVVLDQNDCKTKTVCEQHRSNDMCVFHRVTTQYVVSVHKSVNIQMRRIFTKNISFYCGAHAYAAINSNESILAYRFTHGSDMRFSLSLLFSL